MTCLTSEQLAAAALEVDGVKLPPHVRECVVCQSKLAEMRQTVTQLAAAHAELDHHHAAAREQLLASLPDNVRSARPEFAWKRFALGGLGLSSAIAAILLLAVFANSSSQTSAMERIEKAVRDVTSFSYKLTNKTEFQPTDDKPARTHYQNSYIFWRAPSEDEQKWFGDFRAAASTESTHHAPGGDEKPRVVMDLVETYPTGKPGILIDYVAKNYFRTIPLFADDIKNSPPLLWLRAVREKSGKLVDDLGDRRINGRDVHGYVMTFDDESFKDFGPVDVWVDPQTDLPVEFHFRWARDEGEGFVDKYSATDIQWNIALDPKLFDTTPPVGFVDITLPEDEKSIAEIVAALKLYAELNGGRYPGVEKVDDPRYITKFSADDCYREMLQLAGFTGAPGDGDNETADPIYQRIQQSRAGLDTLERLFHNPKWRIGYFGDTVGAQDKDQLLLWWPVVTVDNHDLYRIFKGDLRTEVVPREKWIPFVPQEVVELTE